MYYNFQVNKQNKEQILFIQSQLFPQVRHLSQLSQKAQKMLPQHNSQTSNQINFELKQTNQSIQYLVLKINKNKQKTNRNGHGIIKNHSLKSNQNERGKSEIGRIQNNNNNKQNYRGLDYISPWQHEQYNPTIKNQRAQGLNLQKSNSFKDIQPYNNKNSTETKKNQRKSLVHNFLINLKNRDKTIYRNVSKQQTAENRRPQQTSSIERNSFRLNKQKQITLNQQKSAEIPSHHNIDNHLVQMSNMHSSPTPYPQKLQKNVRFGAVRYDYRSNELKTLEGNYQNKERTKTQQAILFKNNQILASEFETKCKKYLKKRQNQDTAIFVKKKKSKTLTTVIDINQTAQNFYDEQIRSLKNKQHKKKSVKKTKNMLNILQQDSRSNVLFGTKRFSQPNSYSHTTSMHPNEILESQITQKTHYKESKNIHQEYITKDMRLYTQPRGQAIYSKNLQSINNEYSLPIHHNRPISKKVKKIITEGNIDKDIEPSIKLNLQLEQNISKKQNWLSKRGNLLRQSANRRKNN